MNQVEEKANYFKIEEKLKEPFLESEIEWRISHAGVSNNHPWAFLLAYVQARAIQNRLDAVVGFQNWDARYTELKNGFMCVLSISLGDRYYVKQDGAAYTQIEDIKGGISSAFKRAASAWGVGRYLYNLDIMKPARIELERFTDSRKQVLTKESRAIYWTPPKLPKWALPQSKLQKKVTQMAAGELTKEGIKKFVDISSWDEKQLEEYCCAKTGGWPPTRDQAISIVKFSKDKTFDQAMALIKEPLFNDKTQKSVL